MNCILIAIILVGQCAIAAEVEAKVTDYVDASRFSNLYSPQQTIIRNIIEKFGSEDPEKTAQLLFKLHQAIEQPTEPEEQEFGLADLGKDERFYLSVIVARFLMLTKDNEDSCFIAYLDNFYQTINLVFGKDMDEFVHRKPAHDTKLHAFLVHFAKKALANCLRATLESELPNSETELQMDQLVAGARKLEASRSDQELLSLAKQLDLIGGKFKAREMLDAVEDYTDKKSMSGISAHKRLYRQLQAICSGIGARYSNRLESYNLARLLIPDQVGQLTPSARFLKLNEYWRVCLPLENSQHHEAIYENVKRNMPTVGRRIANLIR